MTDDFEVAPPVLWKTGLAIPVVLVVWTIASSIVSVVSGIANEIFSNFSELFINFWCQIMGGIFGVTAAKWVCERFLKPYSHHVIFVILLLAATGILFVQYYLLHIPLATERTLDSVANSVATIAGAYFLFWRNIAINE